jgi:hypothetical protein
MSLQHKSPGLDGEARLQSEAEEIGRNIRAVMERRKVGCKEVGEALDISASAVTKILGGDSCTQFVKLKKLANYLGVTPNHLLGVTMPAGQALLKGAIAGAMLALDRDAAEADEIATIAVRVLDLPVTSGSPEERGKILAEGLVRQHVDSKRQ